MDLVSVIVPVYNSEKYLRRCIESIINQSYKNIEVILINDGSTDNSGEICNSYALNDARIQVIDTQNNGPSAARNRGIENAKGDFMFFVDADDFIENNALNLLVENYNQCRADIIIGNFKKIKEDNSIVEYNSIFSSNKLLTKQDIIDYTRCYLKKPNRFLLFAYCWGKLFKSSIISKNNIFFNTNLRTSEDGAFNFDYLNYANKVFFLKEPIYNHLNHDNYLSAETKIYDNPKGLLGYRQALSNIRNFLKSSNSDADIRREVGHAYICFTIIQSIRACGQINGSNNQKIYEFIRELIIDPSVRDNLQFYSPSEDDSKILPILMKLKLVRLTIFVCRYKARRRYERKGTLR